MSWFSDEHKRLYSQALGALYEDVKTGTSALVDTTGKLVSTGYEKIKEGVVYLDKKYNTAPDQPNNTNKNKRVDETVNDSANESVNESEIDMSEDTDEYILNVGKVYPDILIKLSKRHTNIIRIFIIEANGTHRPVKGKIESYPYISQLIHQWFVYESRNERSKWYPTDNLYTEYRKSSNRLSSMDDILFRYNYDGYKPFPYHPLL